MAEIWMDVDVNLSEVPVNIMPLLDDTDFKSVEAAVAYNAGGLTLLWNFVATNGAFTQTAVTPTSGGDYDWAIQGNGMYTIEIPASGGASINNDTEGFGWFSGVATGVLPWRGPIIGFRAAGLNNLLIDSAYSTTRGLTGTAVPDAAAGASGGLPTTNSSKLNQTVDLTAGQSIAVSDKTGFSLTSAYDAAKTASKAGDKMDLVDAPNATALTAIKNAIEAAGGYLATILTQTKKRNIN